MIVDAHHHFWDPAAADYPWLTDELAAIRRPFGPADLEPLVLAAGVEATVLVQTRSSLDETIDFLATAEATSFVRGVVGWVDLTDPAVADTIAALRERPGGRFLVGIRHQAHDEPDPDWLLRDDVDPRHRGGRRCRARLRPPRPTARAAGRAAAGEAAPGRPVRDRPHREAADRQPTSSSRGRR